MRRRLLVVVVTVIIAGQTMTASGQADGEVELARGQVVDRTGRPVEGATVEVFLWPDEPTPVGGAVPTVLVGWTTSGPDGGYVVTASDPASLVAAASLDGGYVNLELRVRKDPLLFERFFALPIASSVDTGTSSARVAADTSIRGARVLARLAPGAPGVGRITEAVDPTSGGCLMWVTEPGAPRALGGHRGDAPLAGRDPAGHLQVREGLRGLDLRGRSVDRR